MSENKDMVYYNNLVEFFTSIFGTKRQVRVGDVGIFRNTFTFDTLNDDNHAVKYDVYIKLKAVAVYERLVEVEVMDVYTINTCNKDIRTLIDSTMPKYVYPNAIKWEITENTTVN
jgi:hypothetical protein